MKRFAVSLLSLSLGLLLGCHSVHPFATGGYRHGEFPVGVGATDEGRLVSRDWLVDEWALDANERPVRRQRTYGKRSDLVLRHRTNQGRMWLDVVPVDTTLRDQELRVLAQQAVTAGNHHANNFGNQAGLRMVGAADIAIDGHRAHIALVEAGDGQGVARGVLVFARANYREIQARRRRVVPVLVIVGYVNAAVDFEPGLADFQRFLESVDLAPSEAGFAHGVASVQGAGAPPAEVVAEPTERAAPQPR